MNVSGNIVHVVMLVLKLVALIVIREGRHRVMLLFKMILWLLLVTSFPCNVSISLAIRIVKLMGICVVVFVGSFKESLTILVVKGGRICCGSYLP